jgi:hypothetical protein
MTNTELLQKALDVLEAWDARGRLRIIESIKARLAQLETEEDYGAIANKQLASLKAATKNTFEDAAVRAVHKLYTAPPQREWVGLTNEEIAEAGKLFLEGNRMLPFSLARAIEAKLKEKNSE